MKVMIPNETVGFTAKTLPHSAEFEFNNEVYNEDEGYGVINIPKEMTFFEVYFQSNSSLRNYSSCKICWDGLMTVTVNVDGWDYDSVYVDTQGSGGSEPYTLLEVPVGNGYNLYGVRIGSVVFLSLNDSILAEY